MSNLSWAFLVQVLLNILDALLTSMLVKEYGAGIELNPIQRYFIIQYGTAGMFAFKALFLGIAWIFLAELPNNLKRRWCKVVNVLNLVLLCVVLYSSFLILQINS